MRREQRLSNSSEFALVRQQGRSWSNALLTLRALPNQRETSRFGFLVSRRVGKAVVRNRVKRRLREILRREPVPPGWDLVFIARPAVVQFSFADMREGVRDLLRRARLGQRRAPSGTTRGDGQ